MIASNWRLLKLCSALVQMIFAKALQVVRPRDKESEVEGQWFGMVVSSTSAYSVLWAPSAGRWVRPSITAVKTLLYSEGGKEGGGGGGRKD